jgi:hypothetical protein
MVFYEEKLFLCESVIIEVGLQFANLSAKGKQVPSNQTLVTIRRQGEINQTLLPNRKGRRN